jgi:hypothetical protein
MLLARAETRDDMEIFDERGNPVGRVILPTDTRLFGPDKGTVYLQRPIPAESPSGHSARAA